MGIEAWRPHEHMIFFRHITKSNASSDVPNLVINRVSVGAELHRCVYVIPLPTFFLTLLTLQG